MKISNSLFVFLTALLFVPSLTLAQDNNAMRVEISASDLHEDGGLDGHKVLFEYERVTDSPFAINAGFSLSQSINEVKTTGYDLDREPTEVYPGEIIDPDVITEIREGYNISSLDFFVGLNYTLVKLNSSRFSMPAGIGLTPRMRTESYVDPDGELFTQGYTDYRDDGDHKYSVLTETTYTNSIDLGFYGSLSARYKLFDQWEVSLESRYQFYTKGFPVFSTGLSAHYHF